MLLADQGPNVEITEDHSNVIVQMALLEIHIRKVAKQQ
jgi:hypothetical protein